HRLEVVSERRAERRQAPLPLVEAVGAQAPDAVRREGLAIELQRFLGKEGLLRHLETVRDRHHREDMQVRDALLRPYSLFRIEFQELRTDRRLFRHEMVSNAHALVRQSGNGHGQAERGVAARLVGKQKAGADVRIAGTFSSRSRRSSRARACGSRPSSSPSTVTYSPAACATASSQLELIDRGFSERTYLIRGEARPSNSSRVAGELWLSQTTTS